MDRGINHSLMIVMAVLSLQSFAGEEKSVQSDSLLFGSISITSSITNPHRFDEIRQKYKDRRITSDEFSRFSNELMGIPVRDGYRFPVLLLRSVHPEISAGQRTLNPNFRLDWGSITTIDTVLFRGNTKTKDAVLIRTVKSLFGAVYNSRQERMLSRSLRRFPFIKINGDNEVVMTKEGKTAVLVSVSEIRDNEFMGIVGYVPEMLSRKGYFTGELDLKFRNLSGTGRQLFLNWSKTNQYSQQIKINYREPWIWKSNLFGSFGFEQILRDTLLVLRDLKLGTGFYSISFGSLEFNLNRESTIPTPAGRELLKTGGTITDALGLNYYIDRRDNIGNPFRGFTLGMGIYAGNQRRDSLKSVNRIEMNLESSGFFPLREQLVLAISAHGAGKWLSGEESGYSEQIWFGGAGSLRGYSNDFFRGSRIAWGSLELRRLIGEYSSFYVFFDQGYYYRMDNGNPVSGMPYSYGIGIRLASRMGIIGIDYGFGENDTFSTAKIHIRLISRF
ncbi:MAG: hypothetical protein DRP96_00510 [Candidatus Neomarinimicrobiota bacterium]|nr:MAG: hypothetical protein DRP96_00510 [Candidatus Neomarinimicrobiota bacterium]